MNLSIGIRGDRILSRWVIVSVFIGKFIVLSAQHSQSRIGEASYLMLLASD
ncbi:hypothetical protein [Komarekiella delphini-convector]|uniref:hypothetical protein n=1 Tax=Komarekiella delphini-convector TaxID=3050158 RepID=UPI00177A9B4C|nr:hypothetical protein [Komarekiella delphini-convector]